MEVLNQLVSISFAINFNDLTMKRTILLLFLSFLLASVGQAQPPKVAANKGSNFGEKITLDGAVSADGMAALLKDKNSAEVKVIGKVADVCTMRGCFMYLETSSGKIYIKTKDDSFFVPVELNGKNVVVKGIAERNKESKAISIQATGILVI